MAKKQESKQKYCYYLRMCSERWRADASVKWIDLDSDVTAGGAALTNAQLTPWLFSFGASYQF